MGEGGRFLNFCIMRYKSETILQMC